MLNVVDECEATSELQVLEGYPKLRLRGPYILVRMRPIVKQIGSIVLSDSQADTDANAHVVSQVIAISEDAWISRDDHFPNGARCKLGDLILTGAFTGFRYALNGIEGDFRIMADSAVMAVVPDWDTITKAK